MIWDIDPVLIQFDWLNTAITNGPLQIRYYGLFFAIGLLGAAWAFPRYFEQWGYPRKHGERLTLWTPLGMIVGAHLVHLIFYETHLFTDVFSDPGGQSLEALGRRLIQIGSGLASHGGGIGAILAVFFFARKHGRDPLAYMDPAMCGATFVIPWVRVGNLFNSEIVGRQTDLGIGVWFPRHECPQYAHLPTGEAQELCQTVIYRHPSQVYEALLAFAMLGLAIYLNARWRNRLRPGAVLFILLAYYFTTRFLIEYVKEFQTALDESFPFTMGQCLSAPIVLLSLYMLLFSKKSNILKPLTDEERAAIAPGAAPGKTGPDRAPVSQSLEPSAEGGAPDADAPAKPKKRRKKKK
ncbi:MAG: prolipoprotein diacylglyceryl transferase [Sandaracinaceae bacterium]|nr:prolipoprotein diacylglyceryl transferase [Sandaracinaceae bacterium]